MEAKPTFGIAVDGSCLDNPGAGEFRAIDIATGDELFRHKVSKTTNNIMEFCALTQALKWRKENKSNHIIYTDSVTALAWVKKREVVSNLVKNDSTYRMWQFIDVNLIWLANNTKADNLPIFKWDTANWGENPADFGYKQGASGKTNMTTEVGISKDQLRKWILNEELQPLVDITTLARLKRDFKL